MKQYKVALSRAYERDDAGAIGDVAHNLRLAQMKAGDPKARHCHGARGPGRACSGGALAVPPELILVQAAASYRTGDLGACRERRRREVLDSGAKDQDAVRRAWFIRGLVAADRSDTAASPRRSPALCRRPSRPTSKPIARSCRAAPALLAGDLPGR